MRALDTGLLACAVNRYAPEHARAARVLESLANGDAPWALPWSVVHEFLALVTHPHVSAHALGPAAAWSFVETLAQSPTLRLLGPTGGHAAAVAEVLALLAPESGPLPPGFETAVLLREHGVRELLSADRGMRRFGFLDVHDPLRGEAWAPGAPPARRYRVLGGRRPGP
jgi:predicted nucleic acid-binding protein